MIGLKNVLVPTDFSHNNQAAMEYGCELARRFEAELHLLHVFEASGGLVPLPDLPADVALDLQSTSPLARAELCLQHLPVPAWQQSLTVHRHIQLGTAASEIIRYAREHDIDLIVIGTHGYTGWEHVLLGSVAERVLQIAPCPVLTLRPQEQPETSETSATQVAQQNGPTGKVAESS